MKLVLLGTGGYYANQRRHTACLMLPEIGVVLDAGSGMFRLRHHLATDRLDIYLSHAHLDHVIGLTYLIDMVPAEQLPNVRVYGDQAKLTAVREHLFETTLFPVAPSFQLLPLDRSHALPQGGRLSHFPLVHPGGSLGFRLDWPDRSLAYVTDTITAPPADDLERIRGVDLLIHEAFFDDDVEELPDVTGHSRLSDVARVAADADVGALILVHLNPRLERDEDLDLGAARQLFEPIELGQDQMEIEF